MKTNVGQKLCVQKSCVLITTCAVCGQSHSTGLGWIRMTDVWSAVVQPGSCAKRLWSFSYYEDSVRNTALCQWRKNVSGKKDWLNDRAVQSYGDRIDKWIERWLYRKIIFEGCLSNVHNIYISFPFTRTFILKRKLLSGNLHIYIYI